MADQQNKKTNNLNSLLQKYLSLPKNTPDPRLLQELKKQSTTGMQDALGPAILALVGLGSSSGLPRLLRGASILDAVTPPRENGVLEGVVPKEIKNIRKTASLLPRLKREIEVQTKIDPLTLLHEKISNKPGDFHRTYTDSASQILLGGKIKPTFADGVSNAGVATSRIPSIEPKQGPVSFGIQTNIPRKPFVAAGYGKVGYAGRNNSSFEFENRTKGLPIPEKDIKSTFIRDDGSNYLGDVIRASLSKGKPTFLVPNEEAFRTINARTPPLDYSSLKLLVENSGKIANKSRDNFYDNKWGTSDKKLSSPPLANAANKPVADNTELKKLMDWEGYDSFSKKMEALESYVTKHKENDNYFKLESLPSTLLFEKVLNQTKTKGANNLDITPEDLQLFNKWFNSYVKEKNSNTLLY